MPAVPAVQMLRQDFALLQVPEQWLNDEVINYYVLLLQVRQLRRYALQQLHSESAYCSLHLCHIADHMLPSSSYTLAACTQPAPAPC
jgi:hypothetical protein